MSPVSGSGTLLDRGNLSWCGFAFDPMAGEAASSLGRLTILKGRMNPDLAMGEDLLKKTGTSNLFMVFGEPNIEVRSLPAESAGEPAQLQVEIRGLDVYDPSTGAVRSSSTNDIAASGKIAISRRMIARSRCQRTCQDEAVDSKR